MRFKRSDRDAILVILLAATVVTVVFPLLGDKTEGTSERYDKKEWYSSGHEKRHHSDDASRKHYNQPEGQKPETFTFDPNTADSTQLLRLGLKPWQVRSIYKYRAKGGRYRQKEDFARLYGLTLEDYRRLEPYIRIKHEVMAADVIKPLPRPSLMGRGKQGSHDNSGNSSYLTMRESGGRDSKLRYGEPPVDINTADTTELKRIPGIGSYFARRVVELRQRRQAFASPEDLLAIRNFPETALSYMTASQNFQKVHVNNATLQQLHSHPLINHTQAMDIMKYRRTNGAIHSEKDMTFIPSFTKEQLKRLIPFLLFD